jgi:outer membrane protein, heavy metal efflux system
MTIPRFACLILIAAMPALGQTRPDSVSDLEHLVNEVIDRNPEIEAALHMMRVTDARAMQTGTLPDPEFTFMRELMPGFRFADALMQRLELMQTIPFPSKLSAQRELATITSEHAHHDHLEKINEVVDRVKNSYAELWYAQRAQALSAESEGLLKQFAMIARTRFGAGLAPQQDVLKVMVEQEKLANQSVMLTQQEAAAKAMLMAVLNRNPLDTLGRAVYQDSVSFSANPDTLVALALQFRPMLYHDSLSVIEAEAMQSVAHREYLPDFRLGVQYVTEPQGEFRGWTLIAGISIPFAPWTLSKAASRVDEADATRERAVASYHASRDMLVSAVRQLWYRLRGLNRQLHTYRESIIPHAEQSLRASLTAYQNGTSDFLMLIDAHRTLLDLRMEALMLRMQYEQSLSALERTVGLTNIERVQQR